MGTFFCGFGKGIAAYRMLMGLEKTRKQMVTASGELLETYKANIKEKFSQANKLVINPDIVGEAA
jgi:hypothetical protein